MTDTTKQKFLVFFQIPIAVMEDWMKTDPETRRPAEEKMSADWNRWTNDHPGMILSSEAAGKTKLVAADGVKDTRNAHILVSTVEAPSLEAAAKAFENHPHLTIPQASIEIMQMKPMGPM